MIPPPPLSTLFPYTTLFRSDGKVRVRAAGSRDSAGQVVSEGELSRLDHTGVPSLPRRVDTRRYLDRKSTRLNSSHSSISYAVFCLKKKNSQSRRHPPRTTPP